MRKLILILSLAAMATAARADQVTMTLTGVGSSGSTPPGQNVSEGAYTYPYFFNVVDNTTSTFTNHNEALICDDYSDEVWTNETWNANVYTLSQAAGGLGQMSPNTSLHSDGGTLSAITANPTKVQAYDAAAWLYSQLLNYGLSPTSPTAAESEAFNLAVWAVFDNAAYTSDESALTSDYSLAAFGSGAYGAGSYTPEQLIVDAFTKTATGYSNPDNVYFYTPIAGSQPSGDGLPQEYMGDGPSPVPEPGSLLLLGTGLLGLARLARKRNKASA